MGNASILCPQSCRSADKRTTDADILRRRREIVCEKIASMSSGSLRAATKAQPFNQVRNEVFVARLVRQSTLTGGLLWTNAVFLCNEPVLFCREQEKKHKPERTLPHEGSGTSDGRVLTFRPGFEGQFLGTSTAGRELCGHTLTLASR
jgi:hypothetical protein